MFRLLAWQLPTAFLLLSLLLSSAFANDEFPGRKLFPGVGVIEIDDLHARLKDVVVVDVRSAYEYDTLRVKGARLIPFTDGNEFVDAMRKLRAETDKPIVFYCNGKTCMKSYEASRKSQVEQIPGTLAFDAGIMDWARRYPQEAELLGRSPVEISRLIDRKKFERHLIAPEEFARRVADTPVIVLDMRDRFQREALSLFVGLERSVYLDDTKTLDQYIKRARDEKKTLLIYDAVGRQVQWLQYYLEDQNVQSYFFMKGGARAFYQYMEEENRKSRASAR